MPLVDLSTFIDDEPNEDPPVLKLGRRKVNLPDPMPAVLAAALGSNAQAHQFGAKADQEREGAKLITVLVDLVGPEIAKAPALALMRGVAAAYGLTPEASASSDS